MIYRFSTDREDLEIQEENEFLEDCEPMDVDNYYQTRNTGLEEMNK